MKKAISMLTATALAATLLAGCGTSTSSSAAESTSEAESTAEETTEADTASEEGTVLNIQCWNEEFKTRLEDHYPGYEVVDGTTGKIGDVTVKFTITPSDDNAYQNNLDTVLPDNESADADDKVDIFLVEADYALKYVDTDVTMSIADLGITDDELADQYQYTKDIVTDSEGNLKGVSWQACPGVLFYNRAIATEVLGSDDAETVQAAVSDWATFQETAQKLKDAGYYITSSVMDTYRTYSNNVTTKWVEDGKINIDDNIVQWVEDSKAMYDAGYTNAYELWGDDWSKGFYPEGNVFCYFGPAWFVNFSMSCDQEGSVGYDGGWGICEGPQSFYWGGTWICAATGTDNPTLVADIIRTLCCDTDTMIEIVEADDDFVNNKPAMEEMAASDTYTSDILGGVNPLSYYVESADGIDMSNITVYDQGCNEEFQNAMKNYFEGNATYEEALELFYTAVVEKYPELTY